MNRKNSVPSVSKSYRIRGHVMEALEKMAVEERRSVNALINNILEDYFADKNSNIK